MTPCTKLTLIAAKCRALLALAEKRTPGKWEDNPETLANGALFNTIYAEPYMFVTNLCSTKRVHEDASYIAACAGSAEAGWRSTLAAIEGLQKIELSFETDGEADDTLDAILAAWPDDLL